MTPPGIAESATKNKIYIIRGEERVSRVAIRGEVAKIISERESTPDAGRMTASAWIAVRAFFNGFTWLYLNANGFFSKSPRRFDFCVSWRAASGGSAVRREQQDGGAVGRTIPATVCQRYRSTT